MSGSGFGFLTTWTRIGRVVGSLLGLWWVFCRRVWDWAHDLPENQSVEFLAGSMVGFCVRVWVGSVTWPRIEFLVEVWLGSSIWPKRGVCRKIMKMAYAAS